MSGAKDPAIKLFGRTIPVPEVAAAAAGDDSLVAASPAAVQFSSSSSSSSSSSTPSSAAVAFASADESTDENRLSSSPEEGNKSSTVEDERRGEKELLEKASIRTHQQSNEHLPVALQEPTDLNSSSVVNENHPTANELPSKSEEGHSETSAAQGKTLKKPDKILPCPRCNSMETKFCYFNNYNVNQPRHFCKNCQRYWTAGGTMRNVPVGAGRRKNKNITSHYRHLTVTESLQSAQLDMPNATNYPSLKASKTVLAFGSEPLCESMTSALNLGEKTALNGFHRPEDLRIPSFCGGGQHRNDRVTIGVARNSNPKDEMRTSSMPEPAIQNYESFPPQVPCFPGAPCAYPWNTSQWHSPMPPPTFCPAGFSMPFYPAATYWGCTATGSWNIPWVSQPPQNRVTAASGPNSPTLGKHSRDENPFKPNSEGEEEHVKGNAEKCIWIPKTIKIDDPREAAKISIWTTLGIDNDKVQLPGGRGFFKTSESKDEDKSSQMADTSPLLKANPAALSRSLSFQESS